MAAGQEPRGRVGEGEPRPQAEACFRVLVQGRVQGVGFRWHALERAQTLGVRGWIRNLHDGRVEAWVQGEARSVEAMLAWLETGPSHARVERVERQAEACGPYRDFSVE